MKKKNARPSIKTESSATVEGAPIVSPFGFPAKLDTVCAEVLRRLLSGERLTSLDAVGEASTTRLSAHVFYLEDGYGWRIERTEKAAGCTDGRMRTTDMTTQTMKTIQTFPAVTIEALPTGLFRLEDPTGIDGPHIIELHPAQVQVLASMGGFGIPDKTRRAIERIHGRIQALSARAKELAGLLNHALHVQDLDVTPEAQASECIALNLSEVLKDLGDLQAPDLVPTPGAKPNQGGQMTLPV